MHSVCVDRVQSRLEQLEVLLFLIVLGNMKNLTILNQAEVNLRFYETSSQEDERLYHFQLTRICMNCHEYPCLLLYEVLHSSRKILKVPSNIFFFKIIFQEASLNT